MGGMAKTLSVEDLGASKGNLLRFGLTKEIAEGVILLPKDVVREMVAYFSIRELRIMAEIERLALHAYGELNARYNALLKMFDLLPSETKRMLKEQKAVVSGSSALCVVAPGNHMPGDMDIYTPAGRLIAVLKFLILEGYEVVPWAGSGDDREDNDMETDSENESTTDTDVASEDGEVVQMGQDSGEDNDSPYARHVIRNVVILQKGGDGGPKLNVIESILPCAEAPIFCFHSTVVMNVVTPSGVVCYYPDWTLKNKGVVNRANGIREWEEKDRERDRYALEKYRTRGYEIEEDCTRQHIKGDERCLACQEEVRDWDDGMSMSFQRDVEFEPAGRIYAWRLGQRMAESKKLCWRDRGATIIVQGEGKGDAYIYDGMEKTVKVATDEEVKQYK